MIYVVYRCYYDYDSGSHTNLGYCFDEEAAQRAVAAWEVRKARSEEVKKQVRAWQSAWDDQNPRPAFTDTPRLRLPHEGIPKKKMTEQQLKDRVAAQAAHQKLLAETVNPYREWSERRYAECAAWLKATFTEQELEDTVDGMTSINDEFGYEPLQELT